MGAIAKKTTHSTTTNHQQSVPEIDYVRVSPFAVLGCDVFADGRRDGMRPAMLH